MIFRQLDLCLLIVPPLSPWIRMERVDNQQTHNPYPGYIGCEDHLSPAPEMWDRSWRWYQPHLSSSYTSSYAGPVCPGHEQPSFINNVKTYSTAVNIMSILLVDCIILFCQEFWIDANLFSKLSVACVQNCQKYKVLSRQEWKTNLNEQINYFSSKHVPLLNQPDIYCAQTQVPV